MFKSFLFLFLSLSLLSCGKSGGGGGSSSSSPDANYTAQTAEVPNEALTFETDIETVGFSRTQEAKVLKAGELVKQVIASQEFKDRVLNHKYKGKKTFVDNQGLTNSQIYQRILDASEKLNPGKNNTMEVTLVLYKASTNVIGYTLPTVNKIWMNTKYFNSFTPVDVSMNLTHEWLHKVGFGHAYKSTPSRPYSVPYAVGYLVKELAKKYI